MLTKFQLKKRDVKLFESMHFDIGMTFESVKDPKSSDMKGIEIDVELV